MATTFIQSESNSSARSIYIKNVHKKINDQLLFELFIQAGPLESCIINTDRHRHRFGHIVFKHSDSIDYAMSIFCNTTLFGELLQLSVSPPVDEMAEAVLRGHPHLMERDRRHPGYFHVVRGEADRNEMVRDRWDHNEDRGKKRARHEMERDRSEEGRGMRDRIDIERDYVRGDRYRMREEDFDRGERYESRDRFDNQGERYDMALGINDRYEIDRADNQRNRYEEDSGRRNRNRMREEEFDRGERYENRNRFNNQGERYDMALAINDRYEIDRGDNQRNRYEEDSGRRNRNSMDRGYNNGNDHFDNERGMRNDMPVRDMRDRRFNQYDRRGNDRSRRDQHHNHFGHQRHSDRGQR